MEVYCATISIVTVSHFPGFWSSEEATDTQEQEVPRVLQAKVRNVPHWIGWTGFFSSTFVNLERSRTEVSSSCRPQEEEHLDWSWLVMREFVTYNPPWHHQRRIWFRSHSRNLTRWFADERTSRGNTRWQLNELINSLRISKFTHSMHMKMVNVRVPRAGAAWLFEGGAKCSR